MQSADFVSPPPVADLSWGSAGSDSDDAAAPAPPDVSVLIDTGLFDDDIAESAVNTGLAISPALKPGAAPTAPQPRRSAAAIATDHASVHTSETRPALINIGSLRPANSFTVHSKKQSMMHFPPAAAASEPAQPSPTIQEPPPPINDDHNVPSAGGTKQSTKNKRGSVFTVAATELMMQNLDKFKPAGAIAEEPEPEARGVGSMTRQPEGKDSKQHKRSSTLVRTGSVTRTVSSAMRASEDRQSEEEEMETEIDWSPGSEFVKFASITTLPSLKIVHPPAITDEYMATLAQYKSEFIACVFNASSNRNRSSRMRIFTGRQFVEFCLSDVCKAELRLTERGSAIGIGKLMCLYDFIHEVEDEHDFEDSDDLRCVVRAVTFHS